VALASLLPGVKDTRRPARVSTFWAESAPTPQKSPDFLKSEFFVAEIKLPDWTLESRVCCAMIVRCDRAAEQRFEHIFGKLVMSSRILVL